MAKAQNNFDCDFKVEYDLDEEDKAWLSIINEQRETSCLAPVSADSLELLMDRFEKESYFQVLLNVSLFNNFNVVLF